MQADPAGSVSALTGVASTQPAVGSDISTFKEESEQNTSGTLGPNFENQVRSFSAIHSSNLKRTDFNMTPVCRWVWVCTVSRISFLDSIYRTKSLASTFKV